MWDDRYPPKAVAGGGIQDDVALGPVPKGNKNVWCASVILSAIPRRPTTIIPAHDKFNKTEILMIPTSQQSKPGDKYLVTGWEIDPVRIVIVDSGCSSDTHPEDLAKQKFPQKIGTLMKPIQFDTAADPILCTNGATVKFGVWDVPLDVCLSPGAPSLLSVGQRVMEAGMSFFWIAGKHPCMVIADLKYIVVFDISTNVPVYAPCFERLNNEFLGTFTLADNAFAERCGLAIGATGSIHTILQLSASDNKGQEAVWYVRDCVNY